MASQRQIEANRANGAKGGPKTQAGKERSRLGSLKHGLTSSTLVVLPEEHEHEYEEVLCGFRESFHPHDPAEDALVLRLAQAHWRSLRSRRVETGILHITAKTQRNRARKLVENCPENLNPHEAIGVAFMTMPAEHWQMYMRYDTTISRDFFKTLDALQKLQRDREKRTVALQQALSPAPSGLKVMHAGESFAFAELSENGIRSVSQNSSIVDNSLESKEIQASAGRGAPVISHSATEETPHQCPQQRSVASSIRNPGHEGEATSGDFSFATEKTHANIPQKTANSLLQNPSDILKITSCGVLAGCSCC